MSYMMKEVFNKRQFHEIANSDINFIPESESDILLTAFVQYTVVLLLHENDTRQ